MFHTIIYQIIDVVSAVCKLKSGKCDDNFEVSSDHLKKHVMNCIFICLTSASVTHGHVTDDLSFSFVLPIPKGKNLNYVDSANYRGIALSSIIGAVFNLIVFVPRSF